ncbi:hypothetical protein GCM10025868_40400 [Angustibacter aerolatus]|uniref:Uncharacterized protein n=1 Tax=Angustibacter aerolatus TaxID=1162965 RepID=A0ABQ6JNF9_9ACTN|nr:hypothetical protein GCM10025868_40400 [Angustibacter aerolatus]
MAGTVPRAAFSTYVPPYSTATSVSSRTPAVLRASAARLEGGGHGALAASASAVAFARPATGIATYRDSWPPAGTS